MQLEKIRVSIVISLLTRAFFKVQAAYEIDRHCISKSDRKLPANICGTSVTHIHEVADVQSCRVDRN